MMMVNNELKDKINTVPVKRLLCYAKDINIVKELKNQSIYKKYNINIVYENLIIGISNKTDNFKYILIVIGLLVGSMQGMKMIIAFTIFISSIILVVIESCFPLRKIGKMKPIDHIRRR